MKNTNILISTIVLILLATTVSAQKIHSYTLKQQPQVVLNEGGPIAVHALTNGGTSMDAFGKDFTKSLTAYLKSTRLGVDTKGKGKVHNPWYTTKLYELTQDDAVAKYIIAGDYKFSGSVSNSKDLKKSKEKVSKEEPFTFFYYSNSVSATAMVMGKITVTRVSDGQVVKTLPLNNSKTKTETKNIGYPIAPTVEQYSDMVAKEEIRKYQLMFSPVYNAKNYSFKTVKGDKADKAYRKEMKNKKKVFKALASSGSVNELGKAYEALIPNESKLKKPQDLYYNIGLCYELIGNYTKAKENYLKSANKNAITEIEVLIKYQGMFKKLGLLTEEKDF